MSAPVAESQPNLTTIGTLRERAPGLARAHRPLSRAKARGVPLVDLDLLGRAFELARVSFRTPKPDDASYQKASEWFLDNHYLVKRALRQIKGDLPEHFQRHLPHVGSDVLPRVLRISRAVVEATSLEFDEGTLLEFAEAYQRESPLTIAELWAWPTTLRICVLETLVQTLGTFFPSARAGQGWWDLPVEPAVGVGRAVRALRQLSEIDWRTFFQKASVVDAALSADPSGVYTRMDFETRDAYRKAVEELAWWSERGEAEVARLAVSLAGEHPGDVRQGHVGYYLIDRGRPLLEREIRFRAPAGERLRHALLAHPTLGYLGTIGFLTLLLVGTLGVWGNRTLGGVYASGLCALALVPVSSVVVALTNWAVTALLRPRALPKLDFSERIPEAYRTAVVIPALVSVPGDFDELLAQLELHYLSNPDPALAFVLLSDHADTDRMPDDGPLVAHAAGVLLALNQKYGTEGRGPFHLLHRASSFNAAEGVYMGWERKRGKLEEFNRLLRGDEETSFRHRLGDPSGLEGIRFVITLDADTQLPLGAAQKLIGLLAHPLNHAEFDAPTGRVVSGYTVVQPRIEAAPPERPASWFARMSAGDTALDIYTRAVSDVYQDLFGSGAYVGKGIYDVDAFMQSLRGRVPDNALASHDLFEGIHGRAALASDIVLFEHYPEHYVAFARRLHRWIRGDWQLLPWLFPRWPRMQERSPRLALPLIDRWKIVDNLRRSLLTPSLLGCLVLGFAVLPARAFAWLLVPLAVPLAMSLPGLLGDRPGETLARWFFGVVLLPHEAGLATDAIARTILRLTGTRKHLLQWVTAASAARSLAEPATRGLFVQEMRRALLFTLALGVALAWFRPAVLPAAAPLLALWLSSPALARWASTKRDVRRTLDADGRRSLRLLARRTWLFFETFVGPGDQWLPPDNFQQEPLGRIAHRTSPTNIGLLLVAQLSARDLGYVGPAELAALLQHTLDSVERLERYRGHWLNWYDTKTREPLLPRYVSTVDSGNLAAAFIALAKGCEEQAAAPVLGPARFAGLLDTLALFEQAVAGLPGSELPTAPLIAEIRSKLERAGAARADVRGSVLELSDADLPKLDRAMLEALESSTDHHAVAAFREARTWLDRLHHQLRGLRADLETLFPWLAILERGRSFGLDLAVAVDDVATLSLPAARETCERVRLALAARRAQLTPEEESPWCEQAMAALEAAETRARTLESDFGALAVRARGAAAAMDFTFLFHPERKLFHIGHNVSTDQLDQHYYDLLASEARLASYVAVVHKQAPLSHWYALGRPVTRIRGSVALLSWGGTMFEYLLPSVFMRSSPHTLLAQSMELAVRAHIDYGKSTSTPWGVSESGFAELDAQHNYQYRSFGVPGLGLRRGLEDDLVVAPYACVLGLPIEPEAVLENLKALERLGALGTYGLFEAVDFHPSRADEAPRAPGSVRQPYSVVRSHMAHHQGMVLAALNNALNANVFVERFHGDALVKTAELLLSERLPPLQVAEILARPHDETVEPAALPASSFPAWFPARSKNAPEVALLTNGRLTTLITDSGAGSTRWKGLSVTRELLDPVLDLDGLFIYVRDSASGHTWSATPAPTRPRAPGDHVAFHAHKVEFHHREDGISVRTEIAVAPLDDVEIRHVTLHNESSATRTLNLVSYAEPVLEPAAGAARHPAFSRMFLACEAIPRQHAVLASRRKRDPEEPSAVVVHRAAWDSPSVAWLGCEVDRAAFIGRQRDVRSPLLLSKPVEPADRRKGGVDPVMALALEVTLEPSATVEIAFATAVGRTRAAALEISQRFGSVHAGRWAIRDAERGSARRLERAQISPELLRDAMHLVSELLVAGVPLRAPRETLSEGNPQKRQLWGHGISGDDPLLVVRVDDADKTSLVQEVLAVYRYLRACRLRVELVFLDARASAYQSDDSSGIRRALQRSGTDTWVTQPGGIFVLAIDQLAPDQRRRIEASARVLLDASQGSLGEQLARLPAPAPPLPHFPGVLPRTADVVPPTPEPKLLFGNGYGGFSEDGREYVIVLRAGRATPAPWCNVLANADFGCMVSESSLGSTWAVNSGENRLTPWRNDPVSDMPSEVLYLRDEETAEVWSPTPLPAGLGVDTLVRHGAGYTVYERDSHGLTQSLTVFVPPDAPLKILRLSLCNRLSRPRRLTATYYVEWVLGALREEQRTHVVNEFDAGAHCILARSAWNSDFAGAVAFVVADRAPHGFTCDRAEFIGRSGSLRDPEALRRWGLTGSTEPAADPCAALQTHLELAPGQTLEVHFVLGEASSKEQALALAERFQSQAEIDAAWRSLESHWDDVLGAIRVKTPEPAMDLLLNRWLLYQSLSSRFLARSAFYQSSGAFGFRDQLQDVLAFLPMRAELARAHIVEAAAHQFEAGDVLHWWHPPAGRGVRTRCSDDLLWLPFVVAEYVRATGDGTVLDERIPFLVAPELRAEEHDRYGEFLATSEPASLLEHCRRALRRAVTEGPHGLPLIAGGDWNDGMNRVGAQGRGESVWLAWFAAATAEAFAALLETRGEKAEAQSWLEHAELLKTRTELAAWDGAWYLRAFYDDGSLLGSASSRSCQIDSVAQSWAVLAGARDRERARTALRSADERLIRDDARLILLLEPPFEGARHDPGYIAGYPPGVRENGGQYTHAAAWLGWAHARLGDAAGAARIFRLLNPVLRTQNEKAVERYRVEPYVLAADVYAGPLAGRGGWTWYTGAAAWTYRLGIEAILGLRRKDGHWFFEPCIPAEWPGFEATLRLADREVHVVVENPSRATHGIRALTLDGIEQASGPIVLPRGPRARHEVHIVLGEPPTAKDPSETLSLEA